MRVFQGQIPLEKIFSKLVARNYLIILLTLKKIESLISSSL